MENFNVDITFSDGNTFAAIFDNELKFSIDKLSYRVYLIDSQFSFDNPPNAELQITAVAQGEINRGLIDFRRGDVECKTCDNGKTYCVECGCMLTPCGRICKKCLPH